MTAMCNCEVLVAAVAPWVAVETKLGPMLGSTTACPGSGDAPVGTTCQPTITVPIYMGPAAGHGCAPSALQKERAGLYLCSCAQCAETAASLCWAVAGYGAWSPRVSHHRDD